MSGHEDNIYGFKIGGLNCTVINDGFTEYATADMLFGVAPEKELKEKLLSYDLNPEAIKCYGNCLLIENNNKTILIDTGFGHISGYYPGAGNAGMLADNLKNNGYDAGKIDKVIFTHYHTDHIGGGLDRKGSPAFPKAVFYIHAKDWEKGISIESHGKNVLQALEDRMNFFDGEMDIYPGIKIIPAPGHTPGHSIVKIESAGRELLFISDLAAHPIHFEHPDWSMPHEYDLGLSAKTRHEIFRYAEANRVPMLVYHLPFPGLGYLHNEMKGWSWRAFN